MSIREVIKELAGQNDLLFGQGAVNQTRNGVVYSIERIDKIHPVLLRADLKLLPVTDPNKYFKLVMLYGLTVIGTGASLYRHDTSIPKASADDVTIIVDSSSSVNGCWVKLEIAGTAGPTAPLATVSVAGSVSRRNSPAQTVESGNLLIIEGGTTPGTPTGDSELIYSFVDNVAIISIRIQLTAVGGMDGNVRINIPWPAVSGQTFAVSFGRINNLPLGANKYLTGFISSTTITLRAYDTVTGLSTILQCSDLLNNTLLEFSCTYKAN
jgi:hypothetical protein